MTLSRRACFPVAAIAAVLAAEMAAIQVWKALEPGRTVAFVDDRFALDYRVFYEASQRLARGGSPYASERYVTPPFPALVNYPLSRLPFGTAAWAVAALTVACLLLAHGVSTATFFRLTTRDGACVLGLGVAVAALSYPVYFLVYRGNVDAFVVAPLCLGLWLSGRRGVLAGACIAFAGAMKVYPLLVLVPLLIHGRIRAAVSTVVFLALLFALTPGLWVEGMGRLAWRASCFEMTENASIVCTCAFLGGAFGGPGGPPQPGVWRGVALALYAALLVLSAACDYRRRGRRDAQGALASAVMYLPFMVALPELSFHYSLVLLLPMVPVTAWLWGRRSGPRATRPLVVMTVGLALSQWQAVALACLAGSIVPHCIPGLGLLLVMAGCAWHKASG